MISRLRDRNFKSEYGKNGGTCSAEAQLRCTFSSISLAAGRTTSQARGVRGNHSIYTRSRIQTEGKVRETMRPFSMLLDELVPLIQRIPRPTHFNPTKHEQEEEKQTPLLPHSHSHRYQDTAISSHILGSKLTPPSQTTSDYPGKQIFASQLAPLTYRLQQRPHRDKKAKLATTNTPSTSAPNTGNHNAKRLPPPESGESRLIP